MKVFIDTNVLLDVLAERKAFYADAMRLWTLAERPSDQRGSPQRRVTAVMTQ